MKNISTAMLANLRSNTVMLTTLILVVRTDGIRLGFTSWDVPILYNGDTYHASSVIDPSGVKTNVDLTTDQMDIKGAIDSVYITEADLDAGRYDLAQITIMRVNPIDLTMGSIVELFGTAGQVDYGEGQFSCAVNSLGQQMNQQFGDVITPTCRVKQLGDSQCKVNIASYQFTQNIASVVNQKTLVFNDTHATGYYNYGMIRFSSSSSAGPNYLINMEIKSNTLSGSQNTVVLQEPLPFLVSAGQTCVLEAGCDRRPITCRSKFNNLVNIHSEPYVPGNDYLLATGIPPSH